MIFNYFNQIRRNNMTTQITEQIQIPTEQTEQISNIDSFIERCILYNQIHNIEYSKFNFEVCPVHIFASKLHNNSSCHEVISGTKECDLCKKPMCPICGNHSVTQVSRVTGYLGDKAGWNEAKKQEFKDRKRYGINGDENFD
jgi:hypothetical protein